MKQLNSSEPYKYTEAAEDTKTKGKKKSRLLIPVLLLVASASSVYWYFSLQRVQKVIGVSGRIEGYETNVGAKVTGRVNFVAVREGDSIRKGQLIVQLDDAEIQAQLRGAAARLSVAQQQEMQARLQIDVIKSQIQEAKLTLEQSRGDTKGRIFQSQSTVAAAEAQLSLSQAQAQQAIAELNLARINRDRFSFLVKEGAIAKQQFDQSQTNWESNLATVRARQAAVDAARKQVKAALGGLTQAETTGFNPEIRITQVVGFQKQLLQAMSQLAATQAEIKNAQASQQQISAQIEYLKITSPIDGVVTARTIEPGTVVTTGKTLLTLLDQNTVYLRGYIPEKEIGKVKVGQKANIFLDSNPNKPINAHVASIDPQASFTPENIYFQEDRIKQVFGVKIAIDNPGGFAKPGMPADAEIILKEGESQ
jgi:HlyD family secretion protein